MDLIKITEATVKYNISSRSLRYYEQVGLLKSVRPKFENYRYYDTENIERLKQIMVLRKMQIPVKDIIHIYESEDMSVVVETFVDRIHAIEEEVTTLTELKNIINEFLQTMLKYGIKKISALPLLYDEMDRQLEIKDKKHENVNGNLNRISDKLTRPIEAVIVPLPPMRVLSSQRKDRPQNSDPNGFWHWIQSNGILPGIPGKHEQFEFQSSVGDITILRISDEYVNDSPYIDFVFEGGLFASINIYLDEDVGLYLRSLVKSFDSNKYYEIDYRHDGQFRQDVLLENLISSDERRALVSIFVPVKRRVADAKYFDRAILNDDITLAELETQNPIIWRKTVDLTHLKPRINSRLTPMEDGGVRFQQWLSPAVLPTGIFVKIPFRVDVEFRTELAGLYITHETGKMEVNFGYDVNRMRHMHSAVLWQPIFGDALRKDDAGDVVPDRINTASWIVGEKYLACVLNGKIALCCTNAPYMKLNPAYYTSHEIFLGAENSGDNEFILESIQVTQLSQIKKYSIKKGDLKMVTKQSNNILPDLHPLVEWHHGENYLFDGCMRFLMERAAPDLPEIADFDFFGGISGDTFVQTYGHGWERPFNLEDLSLSTLWNGPDFVKHVFDEIGYSHSYIPHTLINSNKNMYIETLKAYIDKGIPVIQRWVPDQPNKGCCHTLLVGYEENGGALLYLDGDSVDPIKYETSEPIMWDWIFIGDKKQEIDFVQLYKNLLRHTLSCLTAPDKLGCSFGARAYQAWADDIENGWFAEKREYSTYVCLLATNGRACTTLDRVFTTLPELTFIKEIQALYTRMASNLCQDLEKLGAGFDVTLEVMRDETKRKIIADKVREFASSTEEIIRILQENISETQ